MEYVINLYSEDETINDVTFSTEQEAFLHIGRIITNSLCPIEVAVERKYLIKGGVEILTAIVYHLYECNYQCE